MIVFNITIYILLFVCTSTRDHTNGYNFILSHTEKNLCHLYNNNNDNNDVTFQFSINFATHKLLLYKIECSCPTTTPTYEHVCI